MFFVINRRWFDKWKDYICYDYIVKALIDQGKKESDLSINRILSNSSNPGEISNLMLIMERKDFICYREKERHYYCNTPFKPNILMDRDFFIISEPVWKFLSKRYKGEEIKRYAVYKN